jgi:hypothetical protein
VVASPCRGAWDKVAGETCPSRCVGAEQLSILLGSEARLGERGGGFVLACHAPVVRPVLAVTAPDALLIIRKTRAEALLATTISL